MTLLIVEDEWREREGLVSFLPWKELGITLLTPRQNGREGLEAALREAPDLVLTDIRMPLLDGLEMARQLRAGGWDGELIISSGHDEFQYARQAVSLGASEYLLKPIERSPLESALSKSMDRRRSRLAQRGATGGLSLEQAGAVGKLDSNLELVARSVRALRAAEVLSLTEQAFAELSRSDLPTSAVDTVLVKWLAELSLHLDEPGNWETLMAQEGYARKILIDGEPCIIGTLVERSDEKLTAVHDATEAQRLQQQRRAHQQVRAIAAGVDELTRLIEVGLSPDVVSDGPELSDRSERLLRLLHMGLRSPWRPTNR